MRGFMWRVVSSYVTHILFSSHSWEVFSFGADVFGATAFLLNLIGSFRCDFLKFTAINDSFTDHFGIWRYAQWVAATDGTQVFWYACDHLNPTVLSINGVWETSVL